MFTITSLEDININVCGERPKGNCSLPVCGFTLRTLLRTKDIHQNISGGIGTSERKSYYPVFRQPTFFREFLGTAVKQSTGSDPALKEVRLASKLNKIPSYSFPRGVFSRVQAGFVKSTYLFYGREADKISLWGRQAIHSIRNVSKGDHETTGSQDFSNSSHSLGAVTLQTTTEVSPSTVEWTRDTGLPGFPSDGCATILTLVDETKVSCERQTLETARSFADNYQCQYLEVGRTLELGTSIGGICLQISQNCKP